MKTYLCSLKAKLVYRIILFAILLCSIHISKAQIGSVDSLYVASMGFNNSVMGGAVLPDSTMIVVGNFTRCNERPINRVARLNRDGSNNYGFNPGTGANAQVNVAVVESDGKIILGGQFTQYNGVSVGYLVRINSSGSLDTSFHGSTSGAVNSVCFQSDGKILIAGNFGTVDGSTRYEVARLNSNGTLDSTFTTPGTNTNNLCISMDIVTVQSNGQIIIGGNFSARGGVSQNCIARLNSNGAVDTAFFPTGAPSGGVLYGLSILPSGKMIAVGSYSTWNGISVHGIVRLKSNGRIDSTFSPGTGFGATPMALYTQTDSKMIAVGQFVSYQGATVNYIVRIDTLGVRDTTFNTGSGLNANTMYGVFPNYDSKIYACGIFSKANGYARIGLGRFTSTGTLDQSFMYQSGFAGTVNAIATQSNGKVIVAGSLTYFDDVAINNIARFNTNGTLDTSFHSGTGFNGTVNCLTVLPNDKIIVGGNYTTFNGSTANNAIRLNSDGTRDNGFTIGIAGQVYTATFDNSGNVYLGGAITYVNGTSHAAQVKLNSSGSMLTSFAPTSGLFAIVRKIMFQPDGKLLLLGQGGSGTWGVYRMDTLGTLDTSFYHGTGANNNLYNMDLESNGKIIVVGTFTNYNGKAEAQTVMLKSNGTVDSSFTASIVAGSPQCVMAYNDGAIIGGNFGQINSVNTGAYAYVDSTGTPNTSMFNYGTGPYYLAQATGSYVYAAYNDTVNHRFLAGGTYTSMNGFIASNFSGHIAPILKVGIDSISINTPVCASGTSKVHFKNEVNFNAGNTFTVQLSDSGGSFASPITIGTQNATAQGWDSITVSIPSGAINGIHYKVRVTAANPIYISATSTSFVIGPIIDTITASGATTFCSGGSVTLNSQAKNSYLWSTGATTQSVNITSTGTYLVSVTANSCTAVSNSMVVTVHTLPDSLTPTQQDTVVCAFSSTNIYVPSSQTGVRYNLLLNNITTDSAYGNSSTLTINTGAVDSNATCTVLATDTSTGCAYQLIPYLNIFTNKIDIPSGIAPKAVATDTPYTFVFTNVKGGLGSNEIVWALDSNFTTSYTDTSPATIVVTVHPHSDTIIWLKSLDGVSGCSSRAITTIAITGTAAVLPNTPPNIIQGVCVGYATTIKVLASATNVKYKLFLGSAAIDSAFGTGDTIVLNTTAIDTTTIFKVTGVDTSTGSIIYNDTAVYVAAIGAVGGPGFIAGDTLIYAYDTAWRNYLAQASNCLRMVYSVVSGTANIDSTTGKLNSVGSSNITIRATAYGLGGCGAQSTDLPVRITHVGLPIPPAPVRVIVDGALTVPITFTGVTAGTGANAVDWSFDPTFATFNTISSPGTISFDMPVDTQQIFYMRSRGTSDDDFGDVGGVLRGMASTGQQQYTAALLDKINWVYNNNWSEEFNYIKPLPSDNYPSFQNKWSLAHVFGWPNRDTSAALAGSPHAGYSAGAYNATTCPQCCACEHMSSNDTMVMIDVDGYRKEMGLCDTCKPGGHGELTFGTGVATLKYRYDLNTGAGAYANFDSFPCTVYDHYCSAAKPHYSGALLYSNIPMDLTLPGMVEARIIAPSQYYYDNTEFIQGAPTLEVWTDALGCNNQTQPVGYNELDLLDATPMVDTITNYWDTTKYGFRTGGGVVDWDCITYPHCSYQTKGCGYNAHKQYPHCGFFADWHTFTAEWGNHKIIYFIDGKEVFDYNYGVYPWADTMMNPVTYWALDLAELGYPDYVPEYDELVDYVRYYTPATANTDAQCFQNTGYFGPTTLESPGLVGSGLPNNREVYVSNTASQVSNSIQPGTQIAFLNGDSIFYCVNNGLYTFSWYTGLEQQINPNNRMHCVNCPGSTNVNQPNDVKGFITPIDGNNIVCQNTSNGISLFVDLNVEGWYEYHLQTGSGTIANSINNCAGYISVDEQHSIWYRGTDNNLWVYVPNNSGGTKTQITNTGLVNGELVGAPCGCLFFYNDSVNHQLHQVWWWSTNPGNGWRDVTINASDPVVRNSLLLDNQNDRVFFIDIYGAVRYYVWQYTQYVLTPPEPAYVTLGSLSTEPNNNVEKCNHNNNAASGLVLSPNYHQLYYLATDGNIWYYFNDNDPCTTYNTGGNWYKTPLNYNTHVNSPVAVDPGSGNLWFVGEDYGLWLADWTGADNAAPCPYCFDSTLDEAYKTMTGSDNNKDSANTSGPVKINVFPNPSNNSFTFNVLNLSEAGKLEIAVEDLSGRPVYKTTSEVPAGNTTYTFTWDAIEVKSGLYIYRFRVNGQFYSGKIVKM